MQFPLSGEERDYMADMIPIVPCSRELVHLGAANDQRIEGSSFDRLLIIL